MSTWARLRLWILDHQRWFALGSVFSLFGLFVLIDGDPAWLGCLGFLGFLSLRSDGHAAEGPDRTAQ